MTRRMAAGALAVVAVIVVAIVAVSGGSDPYVLKLNLTNASGLKDNSPIVMSGVTRGKVKLHLLSDDRIQAELKIDKDAGPVGKDARVAISASNFLGQKRVEILRGSTSDPAPDGYVVPAKQVTTPTDLDQVLDVLDADTRTRATILLNELGTAVLGRKADINQLLREFPPGFVDATAVLQQLKSDNHSLRDLVTHSDRFVAEATARRRDLVRMVDVLGQTSKTVAAKRTELRDTLAKAPGTLRTLQGFLADLQATTKPLGPAATAIRDSAKPLSDTLAQVQPFTDAARPTLTEARDAAPNLTKLGEKATPVIKKAVPAATSLATLAGDLPPVSDTLDKSADNIFAILENWSRAIQFRDGLGHVFRGSAGLTPDLFTTMVDRLIPPASKKRKAATPKADKPAKRIELPKPKVDLPKPVKKIVGDLPQTIQNLVTGVLDGSQKTVDGTKQKLKDTLGGLLGGGAKGGGDQGDQKTTKDLLDFLLGP